MAEKKFGKRTFRVGEVLATEALTLQARLLQIIGGGLERLPVILEGIGKEATPEAKTASNAAAIAALMDVFGKCDPAKVVGLISDTIALASIQRPSGAWEAADLDGDFTAFKSDVIPVVQFVLKEVLGDFFSGALASGALAKKALG